MGIFETFFPSRVENSYEGPKIVVVLYALVTVVSVVRSPGLQIRGLKFESSNSNCSFFLKIAAFWELGTL